MIYYTTCNDGPRYVIDCLRQAPTEEEAKAIMTEELARSGMRPVEFGYGDPGDYDVKCFRPITPEHLAYFAQQWGIPVDMLNVREPGTHPGGEAWWITFTGKVLVPLRVEEISE